MEFEISKAVPKNWQIKTIADVCERVTSGGTPSRKNPAFFHNGSWPWVKTQELTDRWVEDTEEHITDAAVEASSAKVLAANTVLMAMYGATVGQLGILRRPMTCNQASCAMMTNENQAHFRYLYYLLLSQRTQIKSLSSGAAQQNLSGMQIKQFRLPFPSVEEQRAIAHILGTLDDKIELNRRMNETLEAIARAIFKSWFVDFDPVRAKASGELPESICRRLGLTPDLLALFPDRLVDSELGEIPEGWEWSSVGEEVSIFGGGTPSTTNPEFWNGEYAWVTPKDLSGASAKVLIGSERKITQAGVKKISSGQLPIGTVLLSSRAPIGYLSLAMIPVSINQGFIAMVCDKRLPNTYVLQWAIENLDAIKQRGSGTTFAEISKTNFRPMAVLVPAEHVLRAFHQYVMPLYEQITAKDRESETLGVVRDTLLPKLLSGELRVPDADSLAEATA